MERCLAAKAPETRIDVGGVGDVRARAVRERLTGDGQRARLYWTMGQIRKNISLSELLFSVRGDGGVCRGWNSQLTK